MKEEDTVYHRPRKWENVEDMQKAIDAYIERQREEKRPLTTQGLALALNFNSRQSLLNYEGYEDREGKSFLDTIKKARLKIEEYKVEGLLLGELNSAGVIFDLKNNHGHNDKQQIEVKKEEAMTDEELQQRLDKLEERR